MLEERRNRCNLIEVFKMFNGYTEIDIRDLFTLDGNDKGLCGCKGVRCPPIFSLSNLIDAGWL